MSFFSDLPGKQDKNTELMNYYMDKLIANVTSIVTHVDAEGGKKVSLLVVYNSYDHDIYCVSKGAHEKMQSLVGKQLSSTQRIPSIKGSFEMENFPFPMSQVIEEIKRRLRELGSENNNVSLVSVPIYTHPFVGLFDGRVNFRKLIKKGSCQTIEIDLFW